MINIIGNNEFLLNQINHLINQKKFDQNYLFKSFINLLEIEQENDQLKVKVNKTTNYIPLPLLIDSFYSTLMDLASDTKIDFQQFSFFPFQNLLKNKKQNQCFLSNIQNHIFSLLITSPNGINKNQLYKVVWPHNKDYSVNKLDTHLTNFKKKLKTEINVDIQIKSIDKNITLIID